jgi:DNA-binding NtrC family response regulator
MTRQLGGIKMKKQVLLVDDDKHILRTFTKILEKAGYDIETAETASEAIKKIRQTHYDAALIDIRLPDAEGTDLLLKIPKTSDMAKIIITSYSTVEYGEKAADYGADDFLVKPVKPKELIETVNRLTSEK